jgi:hypothetical protein
MRFHMLRVAAQTLQENWQSKQGISALLSSSTLSYYMTTIFIISVHNIFVPSACPVVALYKRNDLLQLPT